MSCRDSVQFVKGENLFGFTHYHVELTESILNGFEILNSMCLLDNFDHLIFFLECQMGSSIKELMIPPFDVFLVLMTLVTVSNHYKDESLRSNDPYNASRLPLGQRSLKILQFYVNRLKEFDVDKYGRYHLELLRCQVFIAYDSIAPGNDRFYRKKKLRRTSSGRLFDPDAPTTEFREPYKSYISCLDQKQDVLGNALINSRLNQPAEFKNMILWTLSNSLESQQVLYLASHDVWMPLLELLLDILGLRQDYFVQNEANCNDRSTFVQQLSSSPIALFLRVFESFQFSSIFCECVFENCEYEINTDISGPKIHPIYRGETIISNTFFPRVKFTKPYKIRKSFELRRRLLRMCFLLLATVPRKHRLIYPRIVEQDMVVQVSAVLLGFKDLQQFKAFFSVDSRKSFYYLPYIAENTLLQLFEKFGINLPKNSDGRLLENSNAVGTFYEKCREFVESGLFAPWDDENPKESYLDIQKADTCLIALIKSYGKHRHKRSKFKREKRALLRAIAENDRERKSGLPLLHPLIIKLLDD